MVDKKKGIMWMIISVIGFTFMSIIIKYLPNIPIYEKVFFRNSVSCIAASYFLIKSKNSFFVKKENIPFIFGRSLFGFLGVIANFYAIEHLTIADANMLNKLSPVFVTICAYFFLKEKVDKKQIIGIIFMLIATIFVVKPSLSFDILPSLVGLSGAILAGFSYTILRYLNDKVVSEIIVFYFSISSVITAIPLMLPTYVKPSLSEFILLLGIGLSASIGQFGLTYAYKYAPAAEVSIYNYTIILTGIVAGYIFFREIPDMLSLIGGSIIILTAIFLYKHNKDIINE